MLKWIAVTAVVGVLLVMPVARASSFIGFGARVGFDDTFFDSYEMADFELGSGTATVVREEIERPGPDFCRWLTSNSPPKSPSPSTGSHTARLRDRPHPTTCITRGPACSLRLRGTSFPSRR